MFDLLFLLIVLVTAIIFLVTLINLIRKRFVQTRRLLLYYGLGLAIYFFILIAVSLTSPQRVVAMKETRCFDDWCLAIEDVKLLDELNKVKPDGVFYVIKLELSNQARGRSQRAGSVAIHLFDENGNQYDLSAVGQSALEAQQGAIPPLTSTIEVGQVITTFQVFDLPREAHDVVLTIEHPVGFSPGWFIIGDESSLLHKPTIVHLP
ncbi:MAG: hypothetical protein JNM55_02065 [Anaerolineales bacterium]|nr:hypothetical protein [Anaerolineales bacterium]